jgi:hypothetical protein
LPETISILSPELKGERADSQLTLCLTPSDDDVKPSCKYAESVKIQQFWKAHNRRKTMKDKKGSVVLIILGFLFLLNAIFGRYLVLPGYLAGLEAGGDTLKGARQVASTWKIIRFLLWGYSFKLGIYFIILGAMVRTDMSSGRKWVIGVGGFVYIGFAYMPLPAPTSIIFGVAGGIMTLLMIYIFLRWASERNGLQDGEKTASDYRMAGYFFFGMATYTLCPLSGVKASPCRLKRRFSMVCRLKRPL